MSRRKNKIEAQQAEVSHKARDDSACQQPILHHYHVLNGPTKQKREVGAEDNGAQAEAVKKKQFNTDLLWTSIQPICFFIGLELIWHM